MNGGLLNLAFLTHDYPPHLKGGVGRITASKAESLAARGHRVHVVAPSSTGKPWTGFQNGVLVHRIAVQKNAETSRQAADLGVPVGVWHESHSMTQCLDQIQKTCELDIVDAPIWRLSGISALMSGRYRVLTSLQTTHTQLRRLAFPDPLPITPSIEAAEKFLIYDCAGVISNSLWTWKSIESTYGRSLCPANTRLIYHGLPDLRPLKSLETPRASPPRVLTVGRLEKRKGVDLLLPLVDDLNRRGRVATLELVGAQTPATQHLLPAHLTTPHVGTSARLKILGHLSDAELISCYIGAYAALNLSRYESFGLTLIEAMMFGLPIIASRSGAMAEVIGQDGAGIVIEKPDPILFRGALEQLLDAPRAAQEMGEAGRARYEALFTAAAMAEAYEKFVGDLLAA